MAVSVPRDAALGLDGDLSDVLAVPQAPPAGPQPAVDQDPAALIRTHQRLVMAGDVMSAVVAGMTALGVRFGFDSLHPNYLFFGVALPVLWVVAVFAQRGYEQRYLGTGPEEYRRVAYAGLLLFTAIAVYSFSLRSDLARGFVAIAVPLTLLLSLLVRNVLRARLFRLRVAGIGMQRVLVVGRADAVVAVIEKLDGEPQHGLKPVGACVPTAGVQVSHIHNVPVIGDPRAILSAVDASGAHVVAVVSHPDMSGQALRRLSWALEERDVELIVSPGIIEVAGPRLSIRPVAGLSLLHLQRPTAGGGRFLGKMMFDRVAGLLAILVLSPVFLAAALAVRLTSRGPAIFKQTRVGVDGRPFTMYKFRSMVVDAEARLDALMERSDGNGVLFKIRKDPRITTVGGFMRRFSVDELPQLFNVVKGDMSLVGPRPPLPTEVAGYNSDAVRRLRVRPGLTGLWQVSGRSDLSWEESLLLDLRYADNWSLALDLQILWRTVRAVTRGGGAY